MVPKQGLSRSFYYGAFAADLAVRGSRDRAYTRMIPRIDTMIGTTAYAFAASGERRPAHWRKNIGRCKLSWPNAIVN
jgi:hypothetical protein